MSFGERWGKAGEPSDEFDPPNGHYHIKIVDGGAFAGGDGREWAKATLEILDGEYKGRTFVDFMNLNNDVGLRIARENLALYGLDSGQVEDLEDLDNAILELAGTEANVTVSHSSSGFLNVKVAQVKTRASDVNPGQDTLDLADAQPTPVGAYGEPNDDDIPF